MAAKFPARLFLVWVGNDKFEFHTSLADALTKGGREVGVYNFERARVGKLIAEWAPEPGPAAPTPQPTREEIS